MRVIYKCLGLLFGGGRQREERTGKKKGLNRTYAFLGAMKRGYLYLLVFLGLFLAACTSADTGGFEISDVWDKFVEIFSLGFLDSEEAVGAFMRAIVGILVFAVLHFAGTTFLFTQPNTRKIATVIALVLAIMTVIWLPVEVLAGIGASWAIGFAAALIALPVVGGLYLVYHVIPSTGRFWYGIKVLVLIIILWMLVAVKEHASGLVGA